MPKFNQFKLYESYVIHEYIGTSGCFSSSALYG